MSFASFYAGLSGLQANSSRLEVVGNNLANLNTSAFKSSRATFRDIFSGFSGFNGVGNPQQVGRGTAISSIDSIFSQGALGSSALLTDLSIQGEGFFVMANPTGGLSFTRAGNFSFDSGGLLVANNGRPVQGFVEPDVNGNIPTSGTLGDIRIPVGLTAPPQPTSSFNTVINLDSDQSVPFSTTLTVFDSLGERHDLTIAFTPAAVPATSWGWEVSVPGEEVAGGTAGIPEVIGTGTIDFDAVGQLATPAGNPTLSFPAWANGASAQTVDWELYDQDGAGRLTRFADPSAISSSNQNGFGVGALQTLIIDQDGLVSGIFTNGVNLELARIALATFNNVNGLLREGANSFLATNASGSATVGAGNSGGRGLVVSNSIELSNVDITTEFTDMIISQRGYQANSRIITTTDEVIQEAISLKR